MQDAKLAPVGHPCPKLPSAEALFSGPASEHWLLYLRPLGAEADSKQLSLYCAAYSLQLYVAAVWYLAKISQ